MQQVVRLLGDLGERYGAEHTYENLRTPAEAIKLLCINLPELQEELIHAHEHGVGYRLIQADVDLGYDDLALPLGSNDLVLTPVITGSGGGGVGQVLAGVGLVAAAIFLGPAAGGFLSLGAGVFSGATAAAASVAIGSIGASLVLGGVAQLLSPQPTIPNIGGIGGQQRLSSGETTSTDGPQSVSRGASGRQSYVYTGAANTVGVGATIPVAYGQVLSGSHLLSATVDIADDSDPLKSYIRDPGAHTIEVGGETISGTTYAGGLRTRQWKSSELKTYRSQNFRILNLANGNKVSLREADPKEDVRADNYMVFLELDRGLYDYVSGTGSTLVDGFITYKIEVSSKPENGERTTVAAVQGTIQGLLLKTQRYRWMHYISYAQIKDAKDLKTTVSIVDFQGYGRIHVRHNGYELFKNSKLWKVPVA